VTDLSSLTVPELAEKVLAIVGPAGPAFGRTTDMYRQGRAALAELDRRAALVEPGTGAEDTEEYRVVVLYNELLEARAEALAEALERTAACVTAEAEERARQEVRANAAEARAEALAEALEALTGELDALHREKLKNTDALLLLDRACVEVARYRGEKPKESADWMHSCPDCPGHPFPEHEGDLVGL
jgi:hypothetical protein